MRFLREKIRLLMPNAASLCWDIRKKVFRVYSLDGKGRLSTNSDKGLYFPSISIAGISFGYRHDSAD